MSTIIYNGHILPANQACIKYNDRGVTLGHGLFETILIKENAIPLLDYHWQRLETSAALIGLVLPFSCESLKLMLLELVRTNNLHQKTAGARLTLTYGESERGILPQGKIQPNFFISIFEHSYTINPNYSALIVNTRKNEHSLSARIKSISYIDNIFAKQEAVSAGYNEAILLNTSFYVADGAISNIFMVKDNKIFTPKLSDGALPGVIRGVLLNELNTDFQISEQSITLSELFDAEEIFITNALIGIQPIYRLNMHIFKSFTLSHSFAKLLREKKNYIESI